MYTFNSRVRYSEVDSDARLTLDGIINYIAGLHELSVRGFGSRS